MAKPETTDATFRRIATALEQILTVDQAILVSSQAIEVLLRLASGNRNRLVIRFASQAGGPTSPLSLTDVAGDTAIATLVDSAGIPVPLTTGTKITYSVDDPSVLRITDLNDGTAAIQGLKPGIVHLACSDSTNDIPTVEIIRVTYSRGKIKIGFGTPA